MMRTSAEQVYHGKLNLNPEATGERKLFIDLDLCRQNRCKECEVLCSYFYHPANNGILSVAELAVYALVCRRCEQPVCVAACPREALEQLEQQEKILIRYNMRCVSCKSCSHACPYGTIYPENVPYLVHSCDYCLDRREQQAEPLCIGSCPYHALSLQTGEEQLPEHTFPLGNHLLVHSTHWLRDTA